VEGFFEAVQPSSFVTIATPHLGAWRKPQTWLERAFNSMVPLLTSRCVCWVGWGVGGWGGGAGGSWDVGARLHCRAAQPWVHRFKAPAKCMLTALRLAPHVPCRTGQQLVMLDSHAWGLPLLYILSHRWPPAAAAPAAAPAVPAAAGPRAGCARLYGCWRSAPRPDSAIHTPAS
jgi:hypothetical protein